MVTKGWSISVMCLSHVSNNGHQGVASFCYVSHMSNNGHQGVFHFRYVPISCE